MATLRIAAHTAARNYSGGIEGLALALGVNAQVLRNQLVGGERHHLSICTAEAIMDVCNSDNLAHATAKQRGGVFVKLPEAGESTAPLLTTVLQLVAAGGDVASVVNAALSDGRIDRSELKAIKEKAYAQQAALLSLVNALEQVAK